MSAPLQDRVVVVTGGFGSLGRTLAEVLGGQGARLALLDRAPVPAGLQDTERRMLCGSVDLAAAGAAALAMAQIQQRWQCIDSLVNVAGGFAWETLADGSLDTWDRMFAMNLRSAVAASQAVLPHLHAGARIVNIGAAAALKAAIVALAAACAFTEGATDVLEKPGIVEDLFGGVILAGTTGAADDGARRNPERAERDSGSGAVDEPHYAGTSNASGVGSAAQIPGAIAAAEEFSYATARGWKRNAAAHICGDR